METSDISSADILLLQPWVEDFYATDCRSLPMGLAYLAGSIGRALPHLRVFLYDFFDARKRRTLPYPKEFSYLKRYYGAVERSLAALFHHYYRFGESDETILATIARHRPLLIGISALFSPYYRQSLALAALCKKVFPQTPVVIGGNHASAHPQTLLFHQHGAGVYSCDFVIRGEGEESIVELIRALLEQRPPPLSANIVSRDNVETAERLPPQPIGRENLPLPDFGNLDPARYTYGRRPMTFLVTSRSCPHQCTFCSIHVVFGTRYTRRSSESIVAEIRHFYSRGIRHFDIEDDNFSCNEQACTELLERIAALGLADINFSAMNGLSYHSLTPRLLRSMKQVGFTNLNLSLVSSQDALRLSSRRPRGGEHLQAVLDEAELLGLRAVVYFIIGLPQQSLEDAVETLCSLAGKRCLLGPSPLYLTPGSALEREYRHSDLLQLASAGRDPYLSARLTAMDAERADFTRDDLYTVFRLTRVINLLKKYIDDGLAPEEGLFAATLAALRHGEWQTEVLRGEPPPFSPAVHALVKKHLKSICGVTSSCRREITL